MSFLLHSRPLGIGLGLGAAFTSYSLLAPRRSRYALCDSSASNAFNSYTNNAKVPVVTRRGGLNPNAVRQISSGSIAGMLFLLRLASEHCEIFIRKYRCARRYGSLALLEALDSAHRPLDRWRTGTFSQSSVSAYTSFAIADHDIKKQFAESQLGISLIPYNRMQRYFTSIDLRSAMQDNVAFKLAFGATFALTGFAQL